MRQLFTFLFLMIGAIAFGQISTVGIIGTATPGGWSESTPMVQDPMDSTKWSLNITLTDGEAKFRANNAWDINWGETDFPIGTGIQGGPNIPVLAGTYNISFNSATGDYFFDLVSDIGIIGSATPFGWDREVFMFRDAVDTNQYTVTLDLVQGEAKFRADGGWTVNWGATDFPSGIGVQGGPNIPINTAGKYVISFNKSTGAYSFVEQVAYTALGIIGSATAGGWDTDTPLTRDGGNPDLWKGTVELTVGELKFRANNAWTFNWGGGTFPSGTAVVNGDNIAVTEAGSYLVSFNTNTLEYSFLPIGNFNTVGLIGDATAGGWDTDTPMDRDPEDVSIWTRRVEVNNGEAKFRANNDWSVNWGGGTFPSGIATQDGPNIPVVAGEYIVTFNSTTGEYNFEEVLEYRSVSIVGKSGPFNAWPEADDMGARDVFMTKSDSDPHMWTLTSVVLRNFADDTDGGIKFRADTAWTVNWGEVDFPAGTGRQDGPNIQPVAGTYGVAFNSLSGEYAFGPAVSVREDLLTPADLQLMPNPANSMVRLELMSDKLGNEVEVTVFDRNGREVLRYQFQSGLPMEINVSGLQTGTYAVRVSDGRYMIGKQLIVVR
jgi:hypothetical protein